MRIAVYAIARNEEMHVARFLAACQGADLVVVADTGSSDRTAAALREGGAIVHDIAIQPWRFDDARNAVLALVPADVDICVSLDLDETLNPGWRSQVEDAWQPGTTHAEHRYVYAHASDGRAAVVLVCSHIHARHGYRWVYPIHEMLVPDRIKPNVVRIDGLQRDHWPDRSKNRSQYLPMLEDAAAADPQDTRLAYLLGREYVFLGRWAEGEATLRRFLTLPGPHWKKRLAAAMRRIARCRIEQDDLEEGAIWLQRAMTEEPSRDNLVELADLHRRRGDWEASYAAACDALAAPRAQEWRAFGARPHDLASLAAFRLGRHSDALRHAEDALGEEPSDERLQRNARSLRERIARAG